MIKGIIVTGIIIFALLIFTAPVFYALVGYPIVVVGKDMGPNINNGEFIMLDKFTYKSSDPKRGDIVYFKNSQGQTQIQRIIGLPGETLSFLNGSVYINDAPLDEPYLDKNLITTPGADIREGEHIQIGSDSYFLLNDDRSQFKTDSRTNNTIKKSAILAKYWFKIY